MDLRARFDAGKEAQRQRRATAAADHAWVAVDVETATASRASLCSIAAVQVRADGSLGSTFHALVQPPSNAYDIGNTRVHGLSDADTVASPTFSTVSTDFWAFVAGKPLVAHNAEFDRDVIEKTSDWCGANLPSSIEWHCTVELAREVWPELRNYRLPTVCAARSIELVAHHDAVSDAQACARIGIDVLRTTGCEDFKLVWSVGGRSPDGASGTPIVINGASLQLEWTPDDLASAQAVVDAWLGGALYREIDAALGLNEGSSSNVLQRLKKNGLPVPGRARGRGAAWVDPVPATLVVEYRHLGKRRRRKSDTPEEAIVVVFTGEVAPSLNRPPRRELERMATEAGWIVRSSVSKRVDWVVRCDPEFVGTKVQKAESIGVPVVSFDRFLYELKAQSL